jgi:hypothetical protein
MPLYMARFISDSVLMSRDKLKRGIFICYCQHIAASLHDERRPLQGDVVIRTAFSRIRIFVDFGCFD